MSRVGERTADLPPQPPEPPQAGDCCGDGCARCVNDVYADAMQRYFRQLTEWQQRQPGHQD